MVIRFISHDKWWLFSSQVKVQLSNETSPNFQPEFPTRWVGIPKPKMTCNHRMAQQLPRHRPSTSKMFVAFPLGVHEGLVVKWVAEELA